MLALDLVISVDSMPAHLAGALGVTAWTLLPYHADWRWLEHRRDSPWYPTMRLFRQSRDGDWTSTIDDARQALLLQARLRR
jgi:ADP-heptose:LPS heptosyltransferase